MARVRRPDAPSTVTMILCVDPLLEPSSGPNCFPFDGNILYPLRVDDDQDARDDEACEVRFVTAISAPAMSVGSSMPQAGSPRRGALRRRSHRARRSSHPQ